MRGWPEQPPPPTKAPAVQQPPAREMNRRPRGGEGGPRRQTCFFQRALGAPPARLRGLQVEGEMPWDGIERLVRSSRGKGEQFGRRRGGRWGADPHTASPRGGSRSASLGASSSCIPAHQQPGSSGCQSCPARPPAPGCPVRTQRGSKEKIIQRLKNPPGFNSKVRATTYNSSFSYAAGAVVSRCKAVVCWELFLPASKNVLLLNHSVANIIYYIRQYISVFTCFIKRISRKKKATWWIVFLFGWL